MATGQGVRDYLLGSSPREQERLELQASMVGGWTRQYLLSAGLDHGMRVLDLGCGVGNVSLLAAEIVGSSGSVTGIDRDGSAVEKARQRAAVHEHSQTMDFACSNVLDFHSARKYDAVIGRYILLYQPDPAAALRHAAEQVRPGGIICIHEMSFGHPHRSYPEDTLFGRMFLLIGETFRRTGIDPDMGLHLVRHFVAAGLPRPTVKADVPIAGEAGSYAYWWLAETLRSLLPRIHDFGLATAEVTEIDTLAQRMEEEAVAHDSELVGPIQFGAWTTRP